VSAEIETLQNRSTTLNNRLENRRVVERLLGPAAEEISIPPVVVSLICDGPINEDWLKALAELERRSKIVEGKFKDSEPSKAAADIKPLMENLINKVCVCMCVSACSRLPA
jgi:vacuolar protein sorting-associated protein 52